MREVEKPEEKRRKIKEETGFDANVHFVTLSQVADLKRSRSEIRSKQTQRETK